MTSHYQNSGISFVYDGECPMCKNAAHALRIKKKYGCMHLINAREAFTATPLMLEVKRRGFDLDEGMVIVADGQFYHGQEALKFMARHGDARNVFTALCKSLFWSNFIVSLTYPWMRGIRNWLLKRRNVGRINNLK